MTLCVLALHGIALLMLVIVCGLQEKRITQTEERINKLVEANKLLVGEVEKIDLLVEKGWKLSLLHQDAIKVMSDKFHKIEGENDIKVPNTERQ